MSARELTMDDVRRDPEATWAWLRAHALDPDLTAPGVLVRDGMVTATCYLRDQDGAIVLDRDEVTGEVLGRKSRTVVQQVRVPLPDHLGRDIA